MAEHAVTLQTGDGPPRRSAIAPIKTSGPTGSVESVDDVLVGGRCVVIETNSPCSPDAGPALTPALPRSMRSPTASSTSNNGVPGLDRATVGVGVAHWCAG